MNVFHFRQSGSLVRILVFVSAMLLGTVSFAQTPSVGAEAPNFTLFTPTGKSVNMSEQLRGHDLVLVVLRGFPGYQCPYCVKQVHDFVDHASDFAARNTRVLLVYPGPSANLNQHVKDFLAKQAGLPANIVLVTDPDYKVTNLYGLRWDAPHETAYPSTFVLNKRGRIIFEKISHSHGDRLLANDALDNLTAK
jgi:thioredoxin-dependent peroxiredoxin